MEIIYIITSGEAGGAQNYVLSLAKHFKGKVASGQGDFLEKECKKQYIPYYSLKHLERSINPLQDILALFEIRKLLKTLHPDILHANSSKAGVLAALASLGHKTKIVFTAHGFHFQEPLPIWKKILSVGAEYFAGIFRDYTITVSGLDLEKALKYKIANPKNAKNIPNGIAPIIFAQKNEAKKQLGLKENKFIFGCISNFYPVKNHAGLIDAFEKLPEKIKTQCQLALVGTGPLFETYKQKYKNDGIVFCGFRENARQLISAFDAFVLPSLKEGMPYSLLEAMSAGFPIIASDVGAIKETLHDSGLLINPKNNEELTMAMEKLFLDFNLRSKLSQKAIKRSENFKLETTLNLTSQVYQKLLV